MRAKTPEDRRLVELLDPVAEACGYEIVRLRLLGGGAQGRTLQIMAERPSDLDMDISDCAKLSRAISDVLEASDPIAGDYRLEVSSPGIDRPLTRLSDFSAFEGYEAKLELDRLADGRKRFKGLLGGVEAVEGVDHVAIDLEGETETALVPFAWIVDAKLSLTDELLKRGAEKRAERLRLDATDLTPPHAHPEQDLDPEEEDA